MKRIDLAGTWEMTGNGYRVCGQIPGSVYSFLLAQGLMEDPFWRDNEDAALELMEHRYTFSRKFGFTPGKGRVLLHAEGLDTLAEIVLNGREAARTFNMHRTYEIDVTDLLLPGENELSVSLDSPTAYARKMHAEYPVSGTMSCCYSGFYQLRKAHCMFGWDWGPFLPDAGIWRDIYLLVEDSARITEVRLKQRHEGGRVFVTPEVETTAPASLRIRLISPDGRETALTDHAESEVPDPKLWWPNGLGDQPLYTLRAELIEDGRIADSVTQRIGLRTLRLVRKPDPYGEGMYHEVNGIPFFAMGADYIPEDNVFSRITKERSRHLLKQAKDCHFNTIRVWGGGYYPDDWFYDLCDEMGLVVFQDLMVACCMLPDREDLIREFGEEVRCNLKRIRHHASLGVISGNNEVEEMYAPDKRKSSPEVRARYLEIFERMVPEIVREVCPEIDYIPSSPTSGGGFVDPQNEHVGDSHYWQVWHQNKPFNDYRNHCFRYLSEFGFQSFPSEKTVNSFTLPEDRNVFSRIMERHQRRPADNGKILSYLSQTFLYPTDFGTLIYASQVLQALAMRYAVEHLRRNRGRSMGTLYWQFNDIWPGASWASIDYYGRYKVLQYAAKRFYRPVMISCEEVGETTTRKDVNQQRDLYGYETTAVIAVHNDTLSPVTGRVSWDLCDASGTVLETGGGVVSVPPMSVHCLEKLDFHRTDVLENHLFYRLHTEEGIVSEGSVLFTAPKHYRYRNPRLSCTVEGDRITVRSEAFAQFVEIDSPDSDFILEDNCFDMEKGTRTVRILEGKPKTVRLRSVYDIR